VSGAPVRKGAIAALVSPQNSICMEFTDLFVALARAAGIPAREVVGYAYTTNAKLRPLSLIADVLHAWPEYYDRERGIWVSVDPTWANTTRGVDYFTKLDFNHIAFAIHGAKSDAPYPAGFYKRSGTNSKDVVVSFADIAPELPPSPRLTATFTLPKVLPAGLTSKGTLIIENPSGVAANNVNVAVSSPSLSFMLTREGGRIPPYGTWTIPIAITIDNFFRFEKATIASTVNGEISNYYVDIQPAILLLLPFGIAILLLSVGFWYILARRSLWTHRRR
ncbi:transglutaminase domain-containing protein, partial [Candidatus Gottesmanbacteria bacterium]|nr:transglutaminase domain-containing protein [Candidatus Gottesmanbacteria bacterium]